MGVLCLALDLLFSSVNSEFLARVLFRETFQMRSFVKIKSSRNGEITLSFTDVCKSCPSRGFLSLVYMHNLHQRANLLPGAKLHPGVNLHPLCSVHMSINCDHMLLDLLFKHVTNVSVLL